MEKLEVDQTLAFGIGHLESMASWHLVFGSSTRLVFVLSPTTVEGGQGGETGS